MTKKLTKNIYYLNNEEYILEIYDKQIGNMTFINQFFITEKLICKQIINSNDNNFKYLYKYRYKDSIKKLMDSTHDDMIDKIKKRVLLKDDINNIIEQIHVLLFKKIEVDFDFTNENDVEHVTYILYPTIIESQLGRDYIHHTMTVYETGVIEYNTYSNSKLYYLMVDSTPALFNAEIMYFKPHKDSYIVKDANTMNIDSIAELHFRENISSFLNESSNIKKDIDITRFKYYLTNFEVGVEDKILEKMKKLVIAPLDPRMNFPFHQDIDIYKFHQLYFFGNSNALLLFTPSLNGGKVIDKESFLALFFSVYPSAFPLLIDIHATTVTINYHNKSKYSKKEYINLKNQINDIKRTKKRFITPKFRTIYKLSGYLNKILNIDVEVMHVESYLKEMKDYIDFDIKLKNEKNNFRIQLILIFLSLITTIPLIFSLEIDMYLKFFFLVLLLFLVYAFLQDDD